MNSIHTIGQNDSLPKVIATLSAEYKESYPESHKVIYNGGDVFSLYINRAGEWHQRSVTIEENVDDAGKEIVVSCALDAEDVTTAGRYKAYFRNDTINLSFPSVDYLTIAVEPRPAHSIL